MGNEASAAVQPDEGSTAQKLFRNASRKVLRCDEDSPHSKDAEDEKGRSKDRKIHRNHSRKFQRTLSRKLSRKFLGDGINRRPSMKNLRHRLSIKVPQKQTSDSDNDFETIKGPYDEDGSDPGIVVFRTLQIRKAKKSEGGSRILLEAADRRRQKIHAANQLEMMHGSLVKAKTQTMPKTLFLSKEQSMHINFSLPAHLNEGQPGANESPQKTPPLSTQSVPENQKSLLKKSRFAHTRSDASSPDERRPKNNGLSNGNQEQADSVQNGATQVTLLSRSSSTNQKSSKENGVSEGWQQPDRLKILIPDESGVLEKSPGKKRPTADKNGNIAISPIQKGTRSSQRSPAVSTLSPPLSSQGYSSMPLKRQPPSARSNTGSSLEVKPFIKITAPRERSKKGGAADQPRRQTRTKVIHSRNVIYSPQDHRKR